jgi:hypothetical protein
MSNFEKLSDRHKRDFYIWLDSHIELSYSETKFTNSNLIIDWIQSKKEEYIEKYCKG